MHSISLRQLYLIVFMAMAINIHVVLIPYILLKSMRDSWVAVIGSWIAVIPLLLVLHFLYRHTRPLGIFATLDQCIGRWAIGMRLIFALWLLGISTVSLYDVIHWTKSSFLTFTPFGVLAALFALACAYAAHSGWRVLATLTTILLPIVCLFGFMVALGNLPQKDYRLLLPVLDHGWQPIWSGGVFAFAGLMELIFTLVASPRTEGKMKGWHWLVLSFLIAALAIGPITGAIASFGPTEPMHQRFPVFEQWRLLKMGRFISHTDFLAIFQWLSGAFVRITLAWLLLLDIFLPSTTTPRRRMIALISITIATFGFSLIPASDGTIILFLQKAIPWSVAGIVGWVLIAFLCISLYRLRQKKGKGEKHND